MALALFKRMVTCKPNANGTARLERKIRAFSVDVYESKVVSLCLRKAVYRAMKWKSAAFICRLPEVILTSSNFRSELSPSCYIFLWLYVYVSVALVSLWWGRQCGLKWLEDKWEGEHNGVNVNLSLEASTSKRGYWQSLHTRTKRT